MKRSKKLILAGLVLLGLAMISCGKEAAQWEMKELLGVDVRKGVLVTETDTHGGFHGDGMTYKVIQFDEALEIPTADGWHPFPLSKNMTALVYGYTEGISAIAPDFTDEAGNPLVPQVENGSYFFLDRHTESSTPYDDTEIFNRSSKNLTVAIYDADRACLYYLELDT